MIGRNSRDYKIHIGRKIKECRKESQEITSEKADISSDMLSMLERGLTDISTLNFVNLCNALGTTPNHILKDYISKKSLTEEDLLAYEIKDLREKEREIVLGLIKLLKQQRENM